MAVKYKHSDIYSMYYCTFTCYNWLPLIENTTSYDIVYNWFSILAKDNINVIAFVIMPNHIHCILYFPNAGFYLNKIIGNGKRFMAYEIISRWKKNNQSEVLKTLSSAITEREKKKGQLQGFRKFFWCQSYLFREIFTAKNKLHPS